MYRINITSNGANWSDNKTCEGDVTFSDGAVIINYTLDGDKCTLTVDSGKVVQNRVGAQNVNVQFEEGKKTSCIFGSGGLSGSFEILTEKIKIVYGKGGLRLNLEYLSGSDRERVNLTLTAFKNFGGTK
ncbi:MAG: DUF1934 domain-containing protein [Clostridia bacterium]|nr:DUF1934 domain-containing protein [Clostridia bacterium]